MNKLISILKHYDDDEENEGTASIVIPSTLLNGLIFSLKWDGTKFINAVTGLALVNHGSVVPGEPVVEDSAIPGVFVTASSKYLSTPDTADLSIGDIDFMVAVWCNITNTATAQNLVSHYLSAGDQRSWSIAVKATTKSVFMVSATGNSTIVEIEGPALTSGVDYFILAWHDSVANTINIQVNKGTVYSVAHTTGVKDSSGDFTVGAIANPAGYAGGRISADVWKGRILDAKETQMLWNGYYGSHYAFNVSREVNISGVEEVILMGDKNNGHIVISPAMNSVLMAQDPDLIIGLGDFSGPVLTEAQLAVNLSGPVFSAPGNHDDWTVGIRAGFNKFYGGGGYKKIGVPYVDFFLYDYYLKVDESGYYTLAEAEAVTLAARQASLQGQWLIDGLAASTKKWKIVVFHNPAWASPSDFVPAGEINEAINMRWDWVGLGADLMVWSHFHFTERLLKATGSGNIHMLNIGPSGVGADDLGWTGVDPDSIYIVNGLTDVDFNGAHLIKMTISEAQLQIDVSGIDSAYVIHGGKDQLIIV